MKNVLKFLSLSALLVASRCLLEARLPDDDDRLN